MTEDNNEPLTAEEEVELEKMVSASWDVQYQLNNYTFGNGEVLVGLGKGMASRPSGDGTRKPVPVFGVSLNHSKRKYLPGDEVHPDDAANDADTVYLNFETREQAIEVFKALTGNQPPEGVLDGDYLPKNLDQTKLLSAWTFKLEVPEPREPNDDVRGAS